MAKSVGLTGFFISLAPDGEAMRLACLARKASNLEGFSRALNPWAVTNQYSHSPAATHNAMIASATIFAGRTQPPLSGSVPTTAYFAASILATCRILVFSNSLPVIFTFWAAKASGDCWSLRV